MSGPGASVSNTDAVKKYANVVASKSITLLVVAQNFYGTRRTNRRDGLPIFGARPVYDDAVAVEDHAAEFGFAPARQAPHANFLVAKNFHNAADYITVAGENLSC